MTKRLAVPVSLLICGLAFAQQPPDPPADPDAGVAAAPAAPALPPSAPDRGPGGPGGPAQDGRVPRTGDGKVVERFEPCARPGGK